MKLLKHEVDMLPKDKRKEAFKRRKEEKEIEQAEKVRVMSCFMPHPILFSGIEYGQTKGCRTKKMTPLNPQEMNDFFLKTKEKK